MTQPVYNIKQVLFIVLKDKQKVIPVQVVEKTTKATLTGDEISYKVSDPKGENIYDLAAIKAEIYTNPNVVRETMKKRIMEAVNQAMQGVDTMIENSVKTAKIKFGYNVELDSTMPDLTETKNELDFDIDDVPMSSVSPMSPQKHVHQESDPAELEVSDARGNKQKFKIRSVSLGEQKQG